MRFFSKKREMAPQNWGLDTGAKGELFIGGCSTLELADRYGTPLHVVDERQLVQTATAFLAAFQHTYPGRFSAHFAFKCNPVPGVVELIKNAGFKAEVMSAFELVLALRLGFSGQEIVVNGPFKPDELLEACIGHGVRFVIADSVAELERLNLLAAQRRKNADVLLRINPDYIPKGMNSGTATGSRKGSALGLDLKSGEAAQALAGMHRFANLRFQGFHFHIGSGIREPEDYFRALIPLKPLTDFAEKTGFPVQVMDIGGGFAAPLSRELTNLELALYVAANRLPASLGVAPRPPFSAFAEAVTRGMRALFGQGALPELIAEPGRSIAGPNQILLLRIHQVKDRKGVRKWITTDGGIGTVTMPTLYEYHEVFLANDTGRPRRERTTINGPGCFAADVVYRNKHMPDVQPGEILAVMDSGAYFTSWESAFGYPRPAIVAAANGGHRVLRHRETIEEMLERDHFQQKNNPVPTKQP